MWVSFSYRHVGGMRFLRVGNVQLSFCCTRKEAPRVYLDVQGAVACACLGFGVGAIAAVINGGLV